MDRDRRVRSNHNQKYPYLTKVEAFTLFALMLYSPPGKSANKSSDFTRPILASSTERPSGLARVRPMVGRGEVRRLACSMTVSGSSTQWSISRNGSIAVGEERREGVYEEVWEGV